MAPVQKVNRSERWEIIQNFCTAIKSWINKAEKPKGFQEHKLVILIRVSPSGTLLVQRKDWNVQISPDVDWSWSFCWLIYYKNFTPCSLEDLFLLPLVSVSRSLTAMSIILIWVGVPLPNQIPHQLPRSWVDHSRAPCANLGGDIHWYMWGYVAPSVLD